MLVRYVTDRVDADSQVAEGILVAAHELLRDRELEELHRAQLRSVLDWFNDNLEQPSRLRRSRKPNRTNRAISWFRESATDCIDRAKTVVLILGQYGIGARQLKTDRPGYIVYEDALQVVAEPFRDTRR